MGRKPKPTAVKVASGTAAHNPQRLNRREPQQPSGDMTPPDGLSEVAQREWRRLVGALRPMRLESPVYEAALHMLVECYEIYCQAREKVQSTGLAVESFDGDGNRKISRNPYATEMARARADYVRLLVEFGLTPSAKSRVSAESNADGDDAYWFGSVG